MSSLFRLEQQQKKISLTVWGNREPVHGLIHFDSVYFSFFLHLEWNDKSAFIQFRSSLENHTRFQAKMGEVCTRFQTKTAQKPYLWSGTYLYNLRKGEPFPSPPPRENTSLHEHHTVFYISSTSLHVTAREPVIGPRQHESTFLQNLTF